MQMKFLLLVLFIGHNLAAQTSDNPYDSESPAKEGLRRVIYKKRYGFINEKGREVIPLRYAKADDFQDGLAEVSVDGKLFGYIDKDGRTVVPFEYEDFLYGFDDGFVPAKRNGKWGMLNNKGKSVVQHKYDYIYYFIDGLAAARKVVGDRPKCGFVNEKGAEVIPFIYDESSHFNEGIAAVSQNGKFGFIDTKGNIVIPFQYDEARQFSGGRAPVKINGRWGFIDRNNKLVIKAVYSKISGFEKNGEAEVKVDGEAFHIDKDGNRLKPGQWLLLFTKGLNMGEQFWYRNPAYTDVLATKRSEGFRYTDIAQNMHEKEYFLILSKVAVGWQSPFTHGFSTTNIWEKIKTYSKENRRITSIAYGINKWTLVASEGRSGTREVVVKTSAFPDERIELERKKNMFVTSAAYGDDTWIIVFGNERYTDQIWKEYYAERWDQTDVEKHLKSGYAITNVVKEGSSYYVFFTKGTGIKEQQLLWSDEIPMRDIKEYWDKGYKSYRSFYLPRYTYLDKDFLGF